MRDAGWFSSMLFADLISYFSTPAFLRLRPPPSMAQTPALLRRTRCHGHCTDERGSPLPNGDQFFYTGLRIDGYLLFPVKDGECRRFRSVINGYFENKCRDRRLLIILQLLEFSVQHVDRMPVTSARSLTTRCCPIFASHRWLVAVSSCSCWGPTPPRPLCCFPWSRGWCRGG